jgi:hypothetical protein
VCTSPPGWGMPSPPGGAAFPPLSRFRLSKGGRGGKAWWRSGRLRGSGVTHAYLGARGFAAQVVESGRRETAHSKTEAAMCRAQAETGARQGRSCCSGCGELELAQGVEGAFADLARDRQSRHGRVAPLASGAVERQVGGGCAVRVHGRFDQRPAQMRRAGLGEVAAAAALNPRPRKPGRSDPPRWSLPGSGRSAGD